MARFYANENFPLPVVTGLRHPSHDVLTTQEPGHASRSLCLILDFAFMDHIADGIARETIGQCASSFFGETLVARSYALRQGIQDRRMPQKKDKVSSWRLAFPVNCVTMLMHC